MLNVRQITVLSAATLMMLSPMQVMAATKSAPPAVRYGMKIPAANKQKNAIDDVITQARTSPSFNLFYDGWWGNLTRARMDREVAKLIETDPVARAAFATVLAQSGPSLDAIENQHDGMAQRYARGYAGGKYFNMVRDIVRERGMNANDTILWIMNGEINAYTFSASRPRVVNYQSLLDIMSRHDDAIQAVNEHEVTHIEMKHVDISAVVQAVYDAVGRNIIPNEDQSTTFLTDLQSAGRKASLKIIDATGPGAEAFADAQQERVEIVSAILYKKLGRHDLMNLANNIYRALGSETDLVDAQGNLVLKIPKTTTNSDDGKKPQPSVEDQKAFKEANTRLTRGMETTADQGAIINLYKYAYQRATGTDEQRDKAAREYTLNAFATSMAILQGGQNAQVKPFIKQAYDRLERGQTAREDLSKVENGDHPATLFRVIEAIRYMKTPEFKTATNPFLRGLNLYMAIVSQTTADSNRLKTRSLELPTSELLDHRDQGFDKIAGTLGTEIVREIIDEVKAGEPAKAKLLLKSIDSATTIDQLPMINKLRSELRALGSTLGNAIADVVDSRFPVSGTETAMNSIDKAADAQKKAQNPNPKAEGPNSCRDLLGGK